MGRLLLLFLVVPAVELYLLIEVGKRIGTLPTLGIIVLTGVVGASLARRQGLSVMERLRGEMRSGRVPADPLFDGVLILLAGALLITPGILTDAVGFLLLIPPTRILVKRALGARLKHVARGPAPPPGRGKVIDQDDVPK